MSILRGALLLLGFVFLPLPAGAAPRELVVFDGRPVGKTWAKLGAGGRFETKAGAGRTAGRSALVLRRTGSGWRGCGLNWKGWYPADAGDDVSGYDALVLVVRQLTDEVDADLAVRLVDNIKRDDPVGKVVGIVASGALAKIDGTWRRVVLPLRRFRDGKAPDLRRLWGVDFSTDGDRPLAFAIDRISFAAEGGAGAGLAAGKPYRAAARLVPGRGHAIRPHIYGVAAWPTTKLKAYGVPITRWGGNPSSRYNWTLNVDNGAHDWFFKNRGRLITRKEDTGWLTHVRTNQSVGGTSYLTVPMLGWVAKDDHSYGFSVRKYGPQRGHEPDHPDVGNGVKADGSWVKGNPRDTSVPAPPAFIGEGVSLVARRAGRAGDAKPGVQYWVLDNEPMLWHETHRDVHPTPLDYDGLWDRTVRYAEAIKKADPTAKVAGFCSWGWTDLFYSAADSGDDKYKTRPDYHRHGQVPLGEWFIKKCGAYRKAHGKALVDVFDVHWYPQAEVNGQTPYLGTGKDEKLNALRLRTTRDLYDAGYAQESWIRQAAGVPVELLPRVKRWVAQHNPGMEVCLGEYNFGGGDNVTGGLAQAEVFGVLAREQVDLAFLWQSPAGTQELAWKLFRNYDGKGGRFGETYLPAKSDHAQLSVFAARRKDGALTVAAVNKDLRAPCTLTLDVGERKGALRVWRFDRQSATAVREATAEAAKVDQTVRLTLPAASASMLVLTPEGR
jgi:hypothetical protein